MQILVFFRVDSTRKYDTRDNRLFRHKHTDWMALIRKCIAVTPTSYGRMVFHRIIRFRWSVEGPVNVMAIISLITDGVIIRPSTFAISPSNNHNIMVMISNRKLEQQTRRVHPNNNALVRTTFLYYKNRCFFFFVFPKTLRTR